MTRRARSALAFAIHALACGLVALAGSRGRDLSASAAALAILIVSCSAFAALEAGAQVGDDPRDIPFVDRGLAMVTSAGVALAMLGSIFDFAGAAAAPDTWSFVLGLAIASFGAALRARAIRVLGAGFVTGARPLGPERIQRDVYAWMRHPSEVGLWITGAGLFMATGSPTCALGLLLIVASSLVRIRREERYLRALRAAGGRGPAASH